MSAVKGARRAASDANYLRDRVNRTLSRVGLTQSAGTAVVGALVSTALFDTYKNGLVNANASAYVSPKVDLSGLTYAKGSLVTAQLFNDTAAKADQIYNNYCSCNCNYCSCNCNYCSCDCDDCSCDCDRCSCNCDYCLCEEQCGCDAK